MKKIININLSGRVVPIEDSAYESLQRYIESLRRYFMHEEGRDEIINDIESRIAELMNDKIKKGAAAITEADMEEIISSMGRIEDFEKTGGAENTADSGHYQGTYAEPQPGIRKGRLYRDSSDKILGGVCSGIANYLNIDPAIIRLLFALLVFGAGTGFLIYILLWIILPAKSLLVDGQRVPMKRLFRNPDDNVIGGVCGGLGAYFNKEAWIFRIIFAAPLLINVILGIINGLFLAFDHDIFPNFFIGSFTGTFIITYIILWIILPEAKTPYDKMEMRGEKVDVNTIKQNVQEGMSEFKNRMQSWGEEVKTSAQGIGDRAKSFANTRGKEFASEVGHSGRRLGSRIGHVLGILFKAFFLFIAGSIAFGLMIALMFLLFGGGFALGSAKQHVLGFFLNGFWQHAFFWGTIIFFLIVPLVAFITWIVRRIMKVKSKKHSLAYVFSGLWTVGFICLIFFITSMVRDTAKADRQEEAVAIMQPASGRMVVTVSQPAVQYSGDLWFVNDDDDQDSGWDIIEDTMTLSTIKVRVVKSEDSTYGVTVHKYSRGRSRAEALKRASNIHYAVSSRDSVLDLGSGFTIDRKNKFRGQRLIVEIKVPVGKKIYFSESVVDKLNPYNVRLKASGWDRRSKRDADYDWDYDRYFDWEPNVNYIMTADGELKQEGVEEETTKGTLNADSLRREIEKKEKELEEDKKRLEQRQNEIDTTTAFINAGNRTIAAAAPPKKKKQIPLAVPFIPAII